MVKAKKSTKLITTSTSNKLKDDILKMLKANQQLKLREIFEKLNPQPTEREVIDTMH